MRVFITGASGFVGTGLREALRPRTAGIVALSRSRRGVVPAANECWRDAAICGDPGSLAEAMRGCGVIIHLAAHAHQTRGVIGAAGNRRFQDVNVRLTCDLFRAAVAAEAEQFVFISSIGAVCSFSEALVNESTTPRPADAYGRSKLAAERELQALADGTGTALTIIRPCLIYGPGNPGNMARLVALIDRGLPLPFGGLQNRRSLAYLGNVTSLIGAVLGDSRAYGEIFTAADDEIVSTPMLCREIGRARGRPVRLLPVPVVFLKLAGRVGDLAARCGVSPGLDSYSVARLAGSLPCSNQKAKNVLGWKPVLPFDQAMNAAFAPA
jgi:nucleoside-diphosphate-sugar epimerase